MDFLEGTETASLEAGEGDGDGLLAGPNGSRQRREPPRRRRRGAEGPEPRGPTSKRGAASGPDRGLGAVAAPAPVRAGAAVRRWGGRRAFPGWVRGGNGTGEKESPTRARRPRTTRCCAGPGRDRRHRRGGGG